MDTNSRRQKREDSILASLNVAIEGMNHAKDSGIEPTKVVFGHVGTLLTVIRVRFLLFLSDVFRLT